MFEGKPKPLTLRDVRKIGEHDDLTDRDAAMLALAHGETFEAAVEWIDTVPIGVSLAALKAVNEANASTEEARFPVASTDDAESARAAE